MRTTFFSLFIVLCLTTSVQAQTTDPESEHSVYDLAVDTILKGEPLSEQQFAVFDDCQQVKLLMAWPFARHGQVFEDMEVSSLLDADSRYKPLKITPEQVARLLTQTDQDNFRLATERFEKSCVKDGTDAADPPPDNEPAPSKDVANDPPTCPQCPTCSLCEKVDEGKIVAKLAFGYQLEDVVRGGFLLPHRLKALTCNQLRQLQLAVLARHGYIPKDKADADFFSAQEWYTANPKLNNVTVQGVLDVRDMVNLTRLRAAERDATCRRR